jgi:hypothetical protein
VDEDEDDGKEPRTIGEREMINTSADHTDTILDDQPSALPRHAQEMLENTPRVQAPAPAARPETPEPRTRQQTPETHTPSGLEFLGLVTP